MNVPLKNILALVGKLNDQPGEDTPRERFRRFLADNVRTVSQTRDYIEECLRSAQDQYNRALQDLVNHLGGFLGFQTRYGRYQGAPGQIGFDGHWISPQGFHIVVEVKTSEVYPIKTATLANYIDQLVSAKEIPSRDDALGLYVIGRPDPDIQQLRNAIIAEKRADELRIVSVESLLSLAELIDAYDVTHEDILAVLRPSDPKIDPLVDLLARLALGTQANGGGNDSSLTTTPSAPQSMPLSADSDNAAFWLTPVKSDETATADEVVQTLVGREHIYAFGDKTPGRKHIKPGDRICFYATTKGVIAHARVTTVPELKHHPAVRHPEKHSWIFGVDDPVLYLDQPVVIDAGLRAQLDAFRGRDPNTSYWAWLVQATRKLSAHDFALLTRQE